MKEKRILGMDFVRAIATFFIITFHFCMGNRQIYNTSLFFRNIDLGSLGVSLFLILSGVGLIYSDNGDFKIISYFKKRFLAIFPPFWIGYLLCRFIRATFFPHEYIGVPLKNYFFTVIGFDGWLSYKIPTFYITGEWFLGCIIILYLLYPIIRFGVKRIPIITAILICAIQITLQFYYPFELPQLWNPLIRIAEFTFGIYYCEYYLKHRSSMKKSSRITILVVSGILSIFVLCANYDTIPIPHFNRVLLCAGCLFTFLMELGEYISEFHIQNFIQSFSKYSFCIFLVHHPIDQMMSVYFGNLEFSKRHFLCIYIVYVLIIALLGIFLYQITSIFSRKKRNS